MHSLVGLFLVILATGMFLLLIAAILVEGSKI